MNSPELAVTYVGGPTAVLPIEDLRLITDPTFDPAGGEYASGTVSLHKARGPALLPDEIGPIDVALVSYDQHPDNLDHSGRAALQDVRHVLTTRAGAARLGNGAVGLQPWERCSIETPRGSTLSVTAVPARHGPAGIEPISGEVIGFVIRAFERGTDLVYVTGDTVWYEGTREVARRFRPRVVLRFGDAAQVRGPFHMTMSTNDAIEAAVAFDGADIVPVHYEGWAHFTQSQEDLARAYRTVGLAGRLRPVTGGEVIRFD
jgi:L-ascorbate metabolism protein UlaG (beta-lactamase superfamily)